MMIEETTKERVVIKEAAPGAYRAKHDKIPEGAAILLTAEVPEFEFDCKRRVHIEQQNAKLKRQLSHYEMLLDRAETKIKEKNDHIEKLERALLEATIG